MIEGPIKKRLIPRHLRHRFLLGGLALLALLVAGGGGLFLYQQHRAEQERALEQALAEQTQQLAGQVSAALLPYRKALREMARDPSLRSLLQAGDAKALEARAALLAGRLPGVLRLRLLPADISEPRLDENPPLTYASLDLIRRARTSSKPIPAEVHLFGRPNTHLVLLQRVTDAGGRQIGFIHLSLSPDLLGKALARVKTPGYVELRQPLPKRAPLVLASHGDPALKEQGRQHGAPVPGTGWRLVLWLTPDALKGLPAGNGEEGWLPLAGSLLLLLLLAGGLWFWWSRRQPAVQVHPGTSYEGAVRAIMEGQYPGMEHLIPGLKPGKTGEPLLGKGLEGEDITRITIPAQEGPENAEAVAAEARRAASGGEEMLDLSGGMEVEEVKGEIPPEALEQPDLVLDEDTSATTPDEAAEEQPPASIFRAYDIRGVVGRTLTEEGVYRIGLAIGSEAHQRGQQGIVVARDGRLSGPELSAALIRGLRESGRDVIDIGMVPTPVLYFATFFLETGSGVMLTGSHNPPDYNGLKIVLGGETLSGEAITALYQRIRQGDFTSGEGGLQHADIGADYIRRISEDIPVALGRGLKVAVDCGNGVAGVLAPHLVRALGHEVIELFCEVDGNFPNHHPDPSQPENLADLIEAVRGQGADLGLAFDGDGDRLGVVDGQGNIIWPDRQMMLFAIDVLSRNPGADIIFDVKCSGHLKRVIEEHSGRPVMWKTGHSLIKAKMKETGAPLAGEMSGHIFFRERWYGFDDALYAAARLLEILTGDGRPAQEIFAELPGGVATPELRLEMEESRHAAFMEKLVAVADFPDAEVITIDGLRVDFANGWGLIRPSNTTPCLVLRFEGDDEEALEQVKQRFRELLGRVDPDLALPF